MVKSDVKLKDVTEGSSKQQARTALRFFASHPVFTVEEFAENQGKSGRQVKPLLTYHRRTGHIVSLRRGLYATVEKGTPDPLLVAAKITDDAVLAYTSALVWHGLAHSIRFVFTVLSRMPARPTSIGGVRYRFALPPVLSSGDALVSQVEMVERQGIGVRVTTLERTLVDALDRPALCGGWEEVLQSLSGLSGVYLNGNAITDYTLGLQNATLAAKVGYFLETNQTSLVGISEVHLSVLRARIPRTPHYATREQRAGSHLVSGWNLLVPTLHDETIRDEKEAL